MTKIGRPPRLIAYDTDLNIKRRLEGKKPLVKLVRLRTVLYAAIIVLVGGVMLYTLATRDSEGISVIHDRNPMYVRLSDGALRNAYTIRIVNKQLKYREFIISVEGLPSTLIDFVGLAPRADGRQLVSVGPDQTHEVRVVVTDYSLTPPATSTTILFKLIDIDSGEVAEHARSFLRTVSERMAMSALAPHTRIDRTRGLALAGGVFCRDLRGEWRAGARRDLHLRRSGDAEFLQGRSAIRA